MGDIRAFSHACRFSDAACLTLALVRFQAEDGWRLERASILDQVERSKAELSRMAACHRDSELLSRQQVKLDDVHAKLQAALDHKERQAVDQQVRLSGWPGSDGSCLFLLLSPLQL